MVHNSWGHLHISLSCLGNDCNQPTWSCDTRALRWLEQHPLCVGTCPTNRLQTTLRIHRLHLIRVIPQIRQSRSSYHPNTKPAAAASNVRIRGSRGYCEAYRQCRKVAATVVWCQAWLVLRQGKVAEVACFKMAGFATCVMLKRGLHNMSCCKEAAMAGTLANWSAAWVLLQTPERNMTHVANWPTRSATWVMLETSEHSMTRVAKHSRGRRGGALRRESSSWQCID